MTSRGPHDPEGDGELDPVDEALFEALLAAGVDETADQESINKLIQDLASETARGMIDQLSRDARKSLRDNRRYERGFQKRLQDPWGAAMDQLEVLLLACHDAGERFNDRFRPRAAAAQHFRFEAVIRLHARACLVGWEVLTLLKAGLADGAHSRWRTLHEITVIASFLAQGDDELSERYLLHHLITRWRSVTDHQTYADRLNTEPFTPEEVASISAAHDGLLNRFGRHYENEWGWAADALHVPSPNFRQIEGATKLDHWRPYVRMASHAVHAGSQGIRFKLGVPDDDMPLAGPSNLGLADPGMSAALSMNIITATLMTLYPDIEALAAAKAIGEYAVGVNEAFGKAHDVLAARIGDEERR